MSICKDCIHFDACVAFLYSNYDSCTKEEGIINHANNPACKVFKNKPDVVEVRHGEWGFDGLGYTCSECGEYALAIKTRMQVRSDYCPRCGAKMDGERNENGKR